MNRNNITWAVLLLILSMTLLSSRIYQYRNNSISDKYQQEGYDKYNIAITKVNHMEDLKEVTQLLETAQQYGKLDKPCLFFLCDSYIEMGEFKKAEAVIKEVKERDLYSGFYIFDIYIQWKLHGTVPK